MLIFAWGATINYLTRLRESIVEFCWVELLFEVFVSVFAGLVIGLFALASNAGPLMSLALLAMPVAVLCFIWISSGAINSNRFLNQIQIKSVA